MISRFTRCSGAVMTADAAPLDFTVIDLRNRCPVRGGMTGFTDIRRADMAAVLAGCIGAVVTGHTIACDTGVVKSSRAPAAGIVAVITTITAGDVVGGFPRGFIAIVTTDTATNHFTVIDAFNDVPATVCMTGQAVIGCRNVIAGLGAAFDSTGR